MQGIIRGGGALYVNMGGLQLTGLLGVRGIDQRALDHQRRTYVLLGDLLIVIYDAVLKDHLKALKIAAVIELNKAEGLLGTHGADPAAHGDLNLIKGLGICKNLRNQCSFHNVLSCYEIRADCRCSPPE